MKDILINFESYVQNIDNFLAHTAAKPQLNKKDELLMEHMKLTISYFEQLCIDKKINDIINKIIDRLTIEGKPLEGEYKALVYKFFVNAIYLHDTGKINPSYQINVLGNNIISGKKDLPSDHSIYSSLIYIDIFTLEIKNIKKRSLRNYMFNILYSFAYSISRHHGSLNDSENFIEALWKAQENAKRGVLTYYKSKTIDTMDFSKNGENSPFGNGNRFYDRWNIESTEFYILNKLLFSLIITCDYYSTYNYISDSQVNMSYIQQSKDWSNRYVNGDLYKTIQNDKIKVMSKPIKELDMNGLRTRIFLEAEKGLRSNRGNNIFYLEAPTGSGKTNTSINLMIKLIEEDKEIKNVFYIFPFNTLVEQTASTLKEYFNGDIAVVNSITPIIIDEKNTGDTSQADFDTSYLNRLFFHYPLAVTSHINLFNGLFGITRENLYMLTRLCGSVIIMDEIQCYKNKIWRELVIMLQKYAELLNIKIIIMSATLPRLDYMLGDNVPGFAALLENSKEYYENEGFKNRVLLDTSLLAEGKITIEQLVDIVFSQYKAKKGKCLIEFIKKSTARKFFNLLKVRLNEFECSDVQLYELTGDDNIFTRKATIKQIKKLTNIIVVSTQVIEAGVDIDMDYGFKNVSLIDSEEQFLGRINRACVKSGCMVFFFMVDEPKDVYRNDNRIQFTLKDEKMLDYLISKDFHGYYDNIMDILLDKTSQSNTQNIEAFKNKLLKLSYREVHEHMKLIDNRNVQLFLAYDAELESDGKREVIDGRALWQEYKVLCLDKAVGFAERQIKLSQLDEKMSYFTYNVPLKQAKSFHDEHFGFYYIENGEDFIEDGKFMRERFVEKSGGLFL